MTVVTMIDERIVIAATPPVVAVSVASMCRMSVDANVCVAVFHVVSHCSTRPTCLSKQTRR